MLVCPRCQYDNPIIDQSCHRCGTSLTHKTCYECGFKVSFDAENCSHCKAFTGSVWSAIIAQREVYLSEDLTSQTMPQPLCAFALEDYLDSNRRYRLIQIKNTTQTIAADSMTHRYIQHKIIDCQPLQKSVLKILLEEQNINLGIQELKNFSGLPSLAIPYVKLHDFSPAIPEIRDAWQEVHREVLILPDRSQWQILSDLWPNKSLPILQIVYWFDEIAKLWQSLTEIGYGQSLLVESNLRVDEDQTFGLERLYHDPVDIRLTLKDLAQSWQNLLDRSLDSPYLTLTTVLDKVIREEINTVTELRLQLQELADEQQIPSLSYTAKELESDKFNLPNLNQVSATDAKIAHISQTVDYLTSPHDNLLIDSNDELPTAVIPMQMLSLTEAEYTDNGRQRRHNEDCFGMDSYLKKQQSNRG